MNEVSNRARCQGLTHAGKPCKNYALPGSDYCRAHLTAAQPSAGMRSAADETAGRNGDPEGLPEASAGGVAMRSGDPAAPDFVTQESLADGFAEGVYGESAAAEELPPGDSLDDEAETGERRQLAEELDKMIHRVKAAAPDYTPPPFSPQGLLHLIETNLERFSPELRLGLLEKLRQTVSEDLLDLDTWRGIWYMLNYSLEYQTDWLKRRLSGEYDTDEWGLDMEVLNAIKPFFEFMYKTYWRVQTSGIENIPESGRALLVVNHSGQLPWDGTMVGLAVYNEHPANRLVRTLYATWFPTLPFFSALFTKLGQALATEENGARLLEQDELVAVFPEGYKGVGKLFKERYRLARFGRGGFIRMALKSQAPVIPVSVVGAEETYISLAKSPTMARLIHFPYFPISPTFPWLGLLGFVPLPTKWFIDFGEPIPMDAYGPAAANNLALVSQLTDQVRNVVQEMIYTRLAQRKSVFFG